jgi:hypothetical protein
MASASRSCRLAQVHRAFFQSEGAYPFRKNVCSGLPRHGYSPPSPPAMTTRCPSIDLDILPTRTAVVMLSSQSYDPACSLSKSLQLRPRGCGRINWRGS